MRIRPTVVIGFGSTGKYVIANIEKYLYEVLSADQLEIFRFVVLETAPDAGHDASSSATRSTPVDIKPKDLGDSWKTLKVALGTDFDWCPENLKIGNQAPGAGNLRAGGRLMFVASTTLITRQIQDAVNAVREAAQNFGVRDKLDRLLKARGLPPMQDAILAEPAFLVVGTLAGGTCSGGCIDLAYLLARVQPTAAREAVFVLPDANSPQAYKENSWAALKDLNYFTENPGSYHVEWMDSAKNKVAWSAADRPDVPFSPRVSGLAEEQAGRSGSTVQLRHNIAVVEDDWPVCHCESFGAR